MKTLVVLSCIIAAVVGVSTGGLGDIATVQGAVTVTATFPDTAAAPVLVAVTYPTTYDSSVASPALFIVAGSATYSGNNTIAQITITFNNGGDNVVVSAGCTGGSSPCTISGGGYPKFLNTGSYTPSITVTTTTAKTYTNVAVTTAAVAVAATKYTPPTLTAVAFPLQAGCGATSCATYLNGTVTLTNKAGIGVEFFWRVTTPTSGVWFNAGSAFATAGAIVWQDDSGSYGHYQVGSTGDGYIDANTIVSSANTIIPSNNVMVTSGQIYDNNYATVLPESFFGGAGVQGTLTLSGGATTDVTAPTCSVASFAPATITTDITFGTSTFTLTCTDGSGSGVAFKGGFYNAQVTGGASRVVATTMAGASASAVIGVPPYISGTINLIGVFAIDNAGNTMLYGSCGGYDLQPFCGGGGSSASTVSISLFALVILAIFALFA